MTDRWTDWLTSWPLYIPQKHSFDGYNYSLTLSQTTHFRLLQPERVDRRQFQIWWKWQKALQMGRKRCGKRRNCSLQAISPFPSVFKRLVLQTRENQGSVWERGNWYIKVLILLTVNWILIIWDRLEQLVKFQCPGFTQHRRWLLKNSIIKMFQKYTITGSNDPESLFTLLIHYHIMSLSDAIKI